MEGKVGRDGGRGEGWREERGGINKGRREYTPTSCHLLSLRLLFLSALLDLCPRHPITVVVTMVTWQFTSASCPLYSFSALCYATYQDGREKMPLN